MPIGLFSAPRNATCVPEVSRLSARAILLAERLALSHFQANHLENEFAHLATSAGKSARSAITQRSSLRWSVSVAFGSVMRIAAMSAALSSLKSVRPRVPTFSGRRARSWC